MNCEQIKGLLSVYLDDQLTVEQRQAIVEHLDICIECHTILEEYRSYDALLAQLPRVGPPPELRDAIFSASGQRKPRTIFSWLFLSLLLLTLLPPLTDSLGLRLLKQKKTRRHPHESFPLHTQL